MLERKYLERPSGRMAYVDRGNPEGPVVLLVHGNPSSADEFAPVIRGLEGDCRCIAPDHIGFGASDKPHDWDYLPRSHAENLAALLDHLGTPAVTLVVGDWGGPIGLSWALQHPERVQGLLIQNTWCWPVDDDWYYRGFSGFAGGPVGRYLTRGWNWFARSVVKRAWGTHRPLTRDLHAQFTDVHSEPAERKGMWVFPREIIGSTPWLTELWGRRAALRSIPMHLQWGMKDIAFRRDVLERWQTEYPHATVEPLEHVGHFVALEAPDETAAAVRSLLERKER